MLERLCWLEDPEPRCGPENMGMDEVLLERSAREGVPCLRTYSWAGDWISFGYFQRYALLPAGVEAVRRATGGGTVDHRTGQSYSLAVPRQHPWGAGGAAEVYLRFHGALALALEAAGWRVEVVSAQAAGSPGGWCFAEPPVTGDLLHDGRKVAGAALRRNRHGILLQGHTGLPALPWESLVRRLAREVSPIQPMPGEIEAAAALAREKYGSPGWLRMR